VKAVGEVPGYSGPTERFTLDSYGGAKTYATDPSLWQPIYRKAVAARRSKQASKSTGATKADARHEAQQQRLAEAQRRAEEARTAWKRKAPSIAAGVAEAVNRASAAPGGPLAQLLIERTHGYGAKNIKHLVAVGTTAEQLVRHCVMQILSREIDAWSAHEAFPKIAKALGIDLAPFLAADDASAPAKAKRGKKSKRAGDTQVDVSTARDEIDASVGAGPACKYCGCTEARACETDDGPCSWYDRSVPVCSNPSCASSYEEDMESASDDAEDADSLEPAEA
jgi:hypothetical protein